MSHNVINLVILCSFMFPFISTGVVKINSSRIQEDDFIGLINDMQKSWHAGKNFHVESELRNLISVNFTRLYTLQSEEPKNSDIAIPSQFDSRTNWTSCKSIGAAKSQGNCASSYAIVAASVFTDRMCIQKDIVRISSAQHILSCCKNCGAGCFGGFIESSYKYMQKIGLVSGGTYQSKEGCYPYRVPDCPSKKKKMPLCPKIRNRTPSCYLMRCIKNYNGSFDADKIRMTHVYTVPNDEKKIKLEIMQNGPVSATMTLYEDFFNYKRGVYYHTTGAEVGKHDVKIIGWDSTKKSKSHWIVVNSWGKKWGDKGTFKIRTGVNECDIEAHIMTGTFL